MSNLDLYFDVAAVGMSDCLEMGRRMVFKNYLEGKKLTLISSGSGLELFTIHYSHLCQATSEQVSF